MIRSGALEDIGASAFTLYCVLIAHSVDDSAQIPLSSLEALSGLSRVTVLTALKTLEGNNLIIRSVSNEGNIYRILANVPSRRPSPPKRTRSNSINLKLKAFKTYGNRCHCCGASGEDGAVLTIDHIKPVRDFPELANDIDNIQILCASCNRAKGTNDHTDWRAPTAQRETTKSA